MALMQTSRDMAKNIIYFYSEFVGIDKKLDWIGRKDELMAFLNEKDIGDIAGQNKVQKDKMRKFIKFILFMKFYNDMILHRKLKSITEKFLKSNNMPLFPGFDFNQCFESLKFFLENSSQKIEIQNVLKDVLKTFNETVVGKHRNENIDEIISVNGGIKFLINKTDIEEMQKHLISIKLDGMFDFVDSCNNNNWSQN